MLEDLRSALRQLRRSPGFVLAAALSLALGTGANSAMFSFIDGMFLRPLGVPDPDNLVRVFANTEQLTGGSLTWPEYEILRTSAGSLRSVGALQRRGAAWIHGEERTDVMINAVSANFFQTLGVEAGAGRVFTPSDTTVPVVVIGHHAWQTWFRGDPAIVGKTMRLHRGIETSVTIIGVLPQTFRDVNAVGDRDIWMPPATFLAMTPESDDYVNRRNTTYDVFARLAPGRSIGGAKAEIGGLGARLASQWPETNSRRRFDAILDIDYRLNRAGGMSILIMLVVLLVMAIAAVNVANLFLARVEERRRELAVRAAMGASRLRLARQLFAESLLIGIAGLGLGVFLGSWMVRVLPTVIGLPPEYQHFAQFQIDGRVFSVTSAVAMLTAVLFGLAPAVAASRTEIAPGLKSGNGYGGSGRMRLRHWLAVSQISVCLVLLTASALLIQSFRNAQHGDIGLTHDPVLVAWQKWGEGMDRSAVQRIQALPGVRKVAVAMRAPLSHSGGGMALQTVLPGNRFFLENPAPRPIKFNSVTPEFFDLMGVRLLRGRLFTHTDTLGAEPVILISETMANRFWPGEDPVGKMLLSGRSRNYRIIGVVADAPFNQIGGITEPYLYTCWWQRTDGSEYAWLIKTDGPAGQFAPTLRAALKQISSATARVDITTMAELIADATQQFRIAAQLVSGLGFLGLVLAGVGLYGVIARSVSLRTREIGIRMAVGANQREAAGLVVRQTLQVTAVALAVGLPLSGFAASALRAGLFGLSPWYPPAFLVAVLVLFAVAGLASWIPARRAAAVDPIIALRAD